MLSLKQAGLNGNEPFKNRIQRVIDANGYRLNVGIILANSENQVFWAKRVGRDAWQFPQGGMQEKEQPEDTLYRELKEEIGLSPKDVKIINYTRNWLRYRIPPRAVRDTQPVCIGQKQRWFLLKLMTDEKLIQLDLTSKPEFDAWKWVNMWFPLRQVVPFKREVYRRALKELLPYLFQQSMKGRLSHLNYLLEG